MATENAKITDVFIGFEDHGIFTIFVHLEGDGWGQSIGGYNSPDGAFHVEFLKRLLETLECQTVNQLKGQLCRISRPDENKLRIELIGHPIKPYWLNIDRLVSDFGNKK